MITTMPRFKMKHQKFPDEDQGTDGVTSITNNYDKTHPSSSISSPLTCSSTSCPEELLLLSTTNDHDCTMIKNTKVNVYSSSSSLYSTSPQPSIFSTPSLCFTKNKNFSSSRHHLQIASSVYSCASKENALVLSSSISDEPKKGYADPRPNAPPPSSSVSLSECIVDNKTNRDIPVMESCQRRTLIVDHDDSANPNNKSRKVTKNAMSSSTLSSSSLCYYSTSNYYPCTDENRAKTTMVIASVTTILTTLLMTSFKLLWWSHYHHHRHQHHRQQNSKNNYHNLRSSTRGKTPAKGILFADTAASFFSSLIFTYGLLGSYLGIITLVHGQPPPLPPAGFLDFDNLPVTRFSCEGKVIGGYYADVETGCQMFHVCTLGQKDEIQDIKFLCLNGTVFDQETRVCERVDEVDCSKAEQFFDLNLDLYVPHATTQKPEEADLEEEDDIIRPVQSKSPSKVAPSSTSTTRAPPPPPPTTTTTTSTPSPRTRPPTHPPSPPRSRTPVISSSSQQSSSSDEEEEEDDDSGGNNAYTSFNYFLKTPHSHVASGYNSQSRQSYLINQPAGPSRSSSSSGGRSSSPASSTGRKVPSEPGHKTIVYTSSSVSSSSTIRPKTVVVVKATLPPPKSSSILKPKTLATPRYTTTTSTTPLPPPKYELDDQYDEYYDDEDYTVEQQQVPPPSSSSKGSSSYAHYPPSPPVSKSALISSTSSASSAGRRDSYDFRDARSSKGIANAGQTIISTGGTGSTAKSSKVSVAISSKPSSSSSSASSGGGIKVISSEFIGNNSTEEPYYYEDDYPDDITLQQQQQEQLRYGSTPSSSASKGSSPSSSSPSSVKSRGSSGEPPGASSKGDKSAFSSSSSGGGRDSSDYYDDDTGVNVNVHDHHFTHVDVPRIPYAKPNVPRVLVTNGKPFLPRLRRQSHHHLYYSRAPPQLPAPTNKKGRSLRTSSEELRQEARAKAREWGRDQFR